MMHAADRWCPPHCGLPFSSCCPLLSVGLSSPFHPPCCPTSAAHLSQRRCWPPTLRSGTGARGKSPRTGRCRSHWSAGPMTLGCWWQATQRSCEVTSSLLEHGVLACRSWTTGRSPSPGALVHWHDTFRSWPSCMFSSLWSHLGWSGMWHSSWLWVEGKGRVAGAGPKARVPVSPPPSRSGSFQLAFLEVGVYNPHSQEEPSHFCLEIVLLLRCVSKSSKKAGCRKVSSSNQYSHGWPYTMEGPVLST